MNPIYVSGHKNPDTDSIASAVAYANLKRQLGKDNYLPVRLGEVNAETRFVLQRYNIPTPEFITSVKTQVGDLEFDKPVMIDQEMPIGLIWEKMDELKAYTMPVVDENKHMVGLITLRDIARGDIDTVFKDEKIETSIENILPVISATQISGGDASVCGKVVIAKDKNSLNVDGAIVVVSFQDGIEKLAAESSASCVIICDTKNVQKVGGKTAVLASEFDVYRVARSIYQSTPAKRIMKTENLITICVDDYADDVKDIFYNTRYRSYPVVDNNCVVVGMISKEHLMKNCSTKKVVLVDHNDFAQSIPGLKQATILEIIDHHKLGDIETCGPLYMRSEPVGSSATVVATIYEEKGIVPSKEMAGVMLCAILSDTVLFKSPTCTQRDKDMADKLAKIAGENIEELGNDLFTAGSTLVKEGPEAMLFKDFKEFNISGNRVGIGQITIWDIDLVTPVQAEIKDLMQKQIANNDYDMILFMETSIKTESTNLVCAGKYEKTVEAAFGLPIENAEVFLPGVMSRKKQIVPQITQNIQN